MGDHKFNPQAAAKAQGGQVVRLSDLGDGVGFAGFEVRGVPVQMECTCALGGHTENCAENMKPQMVAMLFAVGGKMSTLSLNVELRAVPLGEIGRIPVEKLKALLSADPPKASEDDAA